MKKIFVSLLLLIAPSLHGQWVTVSNDLVRISLDRVTGRYIISDAANTYNLPPVTLSNLPSHLLAASPLGDSNIIRSAMLGGAPHAANAAVFLINGASVVFGSAPGQWIIQPLVDQDKGEILYGWRLGGFDIYQILTIVSNRETLLKDAVSISYQIQNNGTGTLNAGLKMILDPIPGDGQSQPFRLPQGVNVSTESRFTRANMPEYWLSSDREGGLSPYTVRGILRGQGAVRPDSLLFTTLDNALKARWDHYLNTSQPLGGTDTAVVLSYEPREIKPGESQVLSTLVGISGIVNEENNGLKVNASVFSAQETNPARLGFWLTNSNREIFDQVLLELSAPSPLNLLSDPRREVLSLGTGQEQYVEWLVASTSDAPGTYNVYLNVRGMRNGVEAARLTLPFSITWASNTRSGENERIQQALVQEITPENLPRGTLGARGAYLMEDTLGPTSESLAKLRDSIEASRMDNGEELLTLIDNEQQLIKEIIETERSIADVNQQYTILRKVYRRLYESPNPVDDAAQIPLQQVRDRLSLSEKGLKEQERRLDGIINREDLPYQALP